LKGQSGDGDKTAAAMIAAAESVTPHLRPVPALLVQAFLAI